MRKKRVAIHSNFCKLFTGFAKHKKNILTYLARTGKYDLIEIANGKIDEDPQLKKLPWECRGVLPSNYVNLSEVEKRSHTYGKPSLNKIIKEVKPDIYLGIEDIWAFTGIDKEDWWDNINTMIWTTLDSLPLLPEAVDFAPKIKHYYAWSPFVEKAFNQLGYNHVKTLRGCIDTKDFFKIDNDFRNQLRDGFFISQKAFVIGFVFRNQLRKTVPSLLDGFVLFKKKCKHAKLLLHTHWSEGWDIIRLMEERSIPTEDVYTTYVCKKCSSYKIQPFIGQNLKCENCGNPNSLETPSVNNGLTEYQLNQVYNIMDVYCHPFTSGGQEIPIQEAKLTELITLVTNYSCGEDNASEESGGLPLDWHEYREINTQFIKASTDPASICAQLERVYNMSNDERSEIGKKARNWVIENFSIESIGSKLEDIFDQMPLIENFEFESKTPNLSHKLPEDLNNTDFVLDLKRNILKDAVDKNNSHVKLLVRELNFGLKNRQQIYDQIIQEAKESSQTKIVSFESIFSEEDAGKRVAVVIPGSAPDVLLINSLLKNLHNKHKEYNIYVFTDPQYYPLIEDNPYIYKCCAYAPVIDNAFILEGAGMNKGYFEFAYFPHTTTQKFTCYTHNGK
jgi:glycosyltransferase involved in cell wall biosynthesis